MLTPRSQTGSAWGPNVLLLRAPCTVLPRTAPTLRAKAPAAAPSPAPPRPGPCGAAAAHPRSPPQLPPAVAPAPAPAPSPAPAPGRRGREPAHHVPRPGSATLASVLTWRGSSANPAAAGSPGRGSDRSRGRRPRKVEGETAQPGARELPSVPAPGRCVASLLGNSQGWGRGRPGRRPAPRETGRGKGGGWPPLARVDGTDVGRGWDFLATGKPCGVNAFLPGPRGDLGTPVDCNVDSGRCLSRRRRGARACPRRPDPEATLVAPAGASRAVRGAAGPLPPSPRPPGAGRLRAPDGKPLRQKQTLRHGVTKGVQKGKKLS